MRYASAVLTGGIALGLTLYVDAANAGINFWMGAAVAAWMGFSYELSKVIPGAPQE
jgi:hypothetical protein